METHRFSIPAGGAQDDLITLEGWTPRHGSLTLKRQRPTQVSQQASTATRPTDIDLIRPVQAFELRQQPRSTFMQLVHTEEVIPPGSMERPDHRYIHRAGRLLAVLIATVVVRAHFGHITLRSTRKR